MPDLTTRHALRCQWPKCGRWAGTGQVVPQVPRESASVCVEASSVLVTLLPYPIFSLRGFCRVLFSSALLPINFLSALSPILVSLSPLITQQFLLPGYTAILSAFSLFPHIPLVQFTLNLPPLFLTVKRIPDGLVERPYAFCIIKHWGPLIRLDSCRNFYLLHSHLSPAYFFSDTNIKGKRK